MTCNKRKTLSDANHTNITVVMEYIVHGSKNQNDSN